MPAKPKAKPEPRTIAPAAHLEIRTHANGALDEVVGRNVTVHLEQMSRENWYLGIHDAHGRLVQVHLTAASEAVRGVAVLTGIEGDTPQKFSTRATHPNK